MEMSNSYLVLTAFIAARIGSHVRMLMNDWE